MRLFRRVGVLSLALFVVFLWYTQRDVEDEHEHGHGSDNDVDSLPRQHIQRQRGYRESSHSWPAQCGPCGGSLTEFCEMMGPSNMAKTVAYSGTNDRLRRALYKLKTGQPFNVAVIGGSVSGGHGLLGQNAVYHPGNMHVQIFRHLDGLFPAPNGEVVMQGDGKVKGGHGFVNGAQGGTESAYMSRCYAEHIPDDVDLIFIELAINDETLQKYQLSYEILIRTLLDLPSQPAIVNLAVFALSFATIISGGDQHAGLYQFYDLPALTIRTHLAPECFKSEDLIRQFFVENRKTEDLSGLDTRHISPKGHELVANVTKAYLDRQFCEMEIFEALPENQGKTINQLYPWPELPRQMLNQKFEWGLTMPRITPNCFSANGKKHKMMPRENDGWREWSWQAKNYWIADVPGSTISFDFAASSMGIVELSYQRSEIFGLGSVRCWVDDDKYLARTLQGFWNLPYNIAQTVTIRDDLDTGDHILHCEVLQATADPKGGHEFRLIAVMSL